MSVPSVSSRIDAYRPSNAQSSSRHIHQDFRDLASALQRLSQAFGQVFRVLKWSLCRWRIRYGTTRGAEPRPYVPIEQR